MWTDEDYREAAENIIREMVAQIEMAEEIDELAGFCLLCHKPKGKGHHKTCAYVRACQYLEALG